MSTKANVDKLADAIESAAFPTTRDLPAIGFVRERDVLKFIPISRAAWWKGIQKKKLPKPVKLGPKTTAWRVEDIRALIERIPPAQHVAKLLHSSRGSADVKIFTKPIRQGSLSPHAV